MKFLVMFFTIISLVGCSEDEMAPEVTFTADKVNLKVGETVTFTISGDAETFVIYTGDNAHEYAKSHLVITEGQELDQEKVVLTTNGLVNLTPWLTQIIDNYNASSQLSATPIDIEVVLDDLETLVDKEYTNKETAVYEAYLFLTELNGDGTGRAQNVAREMVNEYYEDNSILLAPEDGFSTGVAVSRYEKNYEYAYSKPGVYTVTLIATNVSSERYTGSGYNDDRTTSGDEYDLSRTIKELIITVQ